MITVINHPEVDTTALNPPPGEPSTWSSRNLDDHTVSIKFVMTHPEFVRGFNDVRQKRPFKDAPCCADYYERGRQLAVIYKGPLYVLNGNGKLSLTFSAYEAFHMAYQSGDIL